MSAKLTGSTLCHPCPQAKREALRRAVNLLSQGAAARCFVAWRSLAAAMALKRAAFARKQAALRQAVAIGDAIVRQRRWVGTMGWWWGGGCQQEEPQTGSLWLNILPCALPIALLHPGGSWRCPA